MKKFSENTFKKSLKCLFWYGMISLNSRSTFE